MKKEKEKREVTEFKATVKSWKNGGAYVSVPSSWEGKRVIVRKEEDPFRD